MNLFKSVTKLTSLILLWIACSPALAQDNYPSRPVRLIIPFAPGGSTDIVGRQLAQKLAAHLGGTIVSENKGGGGGLIGTAEVARAKPDGYTLLFSASSTQIIGPAMMDKPAYDGIKDFSPISLVGLQYMALVSGPAAPGKTAVEFLAAARANPGKFGYGSAGPGSINHLTGELFNRQAKLSLIHVPYKGMGPAMTDLMGGHLAVVMSTTGSVLAQVRAGKARLLMTFSEGRLKSTPDTPTAGELGIPGMEVSTFSGLFAPAATPRALVERINQSAQKVMADRDFQSQLEKLGIEPVTDSTPESTARYVQVFNDRLLPVIRALRAQGAN